MKTQLLNNRAGLAVAALTALISLTSGANAIPLQFEAPPGPVYTTGGIKMKFTDLDMGTVYPNLAPSPVSYGNPANVASGVAILDALTLLGNQATGAKGGSPFGNGIEDSWGIADVTQIFANPGSATNPIFTAFVKGFELNAVFYGAQDFAVRINPDGSQSTESVGLRIDLYRNPIGTYDTAKLLGSAGHLTQNSYALISAGGPATLELSFLSTPGGYLGNALTEFQTTYSPGLGGTGSAYLNVIGGLSAAQFDTNSINLASGGKADISINFTTRGTLDNTNSIPGGTDWLLSSEDPLLGAVVPEPTTVLAGLGCLLPMLLGRRRKSASVV